MPDTTGSYQTLSFPRERHAMEALLTAASVKRAVHGLVEVDVTDARRLVKERGLSFTAYLAACLARALDEHKMVQAMRSGRRKLVVFDDVDVSVLVEHRTASGKLPLPHVLRRVNHRTVEDVHAAIRAAQASTPAQSFRWMRLFGYLPSFLLRLVIGWVMRSPRLTKRFAGTAGLTAVGMFGRSTGWGIPVPLASIVLTVGGIGVRPGFVDDEVRPREYLCLTLSFDHDVVDGAPAARFARRLEELVRTAEVLRAPTEDPAPEPANPVGRKPGEAPAPVDRL